MLLDLVIKKKPQSQSFKIEINNLYLLNFFNILHNAKEKKPCHSEFC